MEILFYSTECPKCKILQRKLEDKGISFKKISKIRKPNLIFLKGNHILFSLYPRTLAQKIKNFFKKTRLFNI